jgi:TonB-dependent receptor
MSPPQVSRPCAAAASSFKLIAERGVTMQCKRRLSAFLLWVFVAGTWTSRLQAQPKGSATGRVTDASDGTPLWGVAVMVKNTMIGTSSNDEGRFRISQLTEGNTILVFRYVGYESEERNVLIEADKATTVDVRLRSVAIEGEEVVVTAQRQGQQGAINKQISSNKIVNVVSKDKIQELPDQNAAESIGRLPGVSVQRDAGEGTKLIVRGLAPKFNSITVNGQRIPATDQQDRSVDLSMISSDILAGIEVVKSATPDQDGDAIGGTVNFEIKKADEGPRYDVRALGGYNHMHKDLSNFRGSFTVGDRFSENALGVLLTGNWQRANRGSDNLSGSYEYGGVSPQGESLLRLTSLNLYDRMETRYRYGANLIMDYKFDNSELLLSSLYSRTDRDETRRRKRYRTDAAYTEYWLRTSQISTDLFTNSLSGKHDFGFINARWQASYSLSMQRIPFFHDSQFQEQGAFIRGLQPNEGPEDVPATARNDTSRTFFLYDYYSSDRTKDEDLTAQVDFALPLALTDNITAKVSFGAKMREKRREVDKEYYVTESQTMRTLARTYPGRWVIDNVNNNNIRLCNFQEDGYTYDEFLSGRFSLGPAALSVAKLDAFMNEFKSLYVKDLLLDLEDYRASESIYAGYMMAEINIGPILMVLPGFRYEKTITDYNNIFGEILQDPEGNEYVSNAVDTLGSRSYDEVLPMVHVRVRPLDWMDVRFAFTKTLSRPDYRNLVPWRRVDGGDIEQGQPFLKHTLAWNYDLFLTLHNNYGLVSIGGFRKVLRDIDYIRTSRVRSGSRIVSLIQPENTPYDTRVWGMELEIQTNLSMLPSPFDGIVISANYSRMWSETFFPYLVSWQNPRPPFNFVYKDSVRSSRMPGQANEIANLTLGYEKGIFSGRVSFLYQGDALQTVGPSPELDGYSMKSARWDLALEFKAFPGFSVITNVNNLSSLPEGAFIGSEHFPTQEEYFGWTMEFGVRYRF